jgi:hypothetical protein
MATYSKTETKQKLDEVEKSIRADVMENAEVCHP